MNIGHKFSRTAALYPIALLSLTAFSLFSFMPQELLRDSLGWAMNVESGGPKIYNPHHLLYMPIIRFIYLTCSEFGGHCNAITIGIFHGAAWSFVFVLASYYIFLKLSARPLTALLLAMFLLTSNSIWSLAIQPQAYMPMLGAFSLLVLLLFTYNKDSYSIGWILLVSVIYSITTLYHQTMVLLGLPIAIYLLCEKKRNSRFAAASIIGFSAIILITIYFLASYAYFHDASIKALLRFIFLYKVVMSDPNFATTDNLNLSNLLLLFKSQANALIFLPWNLRGLFTTIYAFLVVFLIAQNALFAKQKSIFSNERIFAIISILIFSGAQLWANANDSAWPTMIALPLAVLICISITDYSSKFLRTKAAYVTHSLIMATIVTGIAARNFKEQILPMHLSKGRHYEYAATIAAAIPKQCTIMEISGYDNYNLAYYHARKTLDYWDLITEYYFGNPSSSINVPKLKQYGESSECMAVDSRYIDPTLGIAGKSGLDAPVEWWGLIRVIFGLEPMEGKSYRWKQFHTIRADNKHLYFIINNFQYKESGSPMDFLKKLEVGSQRVGIDMAKHLNEWRNEYCAIVQSSNPKSAVCAR